MPDHDNAVWDCPHCGTTIDNGFEACWQCGTTREGKADPDFVKADLVPMPARPRCRACGYPIQGLTDERCPECGAPVALVRYQTAPEPDRVPTKEAVRRRRFWLLAWAVTWVVWITVAILMIDHVPEHSALARHIRLVFLALTVWALLVPFVFLAQMMRGRQQ